MLFSVGVSIAEAGTERLKIINGCNQKIWITHLANANHSDQALHVTPTDLMPLRLVSGQGHRTTASNPEAP